MPRFLFLFHTVPVFIPKSFFKESDKSISVFVWNKTIPRIRRADLEKQKEAGGLALPHFLQYYWAANIYKLIYCVSASYEGDGPVWVEMEQHSTHPVSLPTSVCAPLPLSKQRLTNNLIVSSSLQIWSQFRTHFKRRQAMPSLPISANALFPPSLMDTAFKLWFRNGLKRVKDLFKDGVFMSFEQLVSEYNIPSSHSFRYWQVRAFVRKHFPSCTIIPEGPYCSLLCFTAPPVLRGWPSHNSKSELKISRKKGVLVPSTLSVEQSATCNQGVGLC